MVEKSDGGAPPPASGQPAGAPGPQEVRLRVDERNIRTSYANVFLTHATPNEVMIDFALNLGPRPGQPGTQPEMLWQAGERIILSYYGAKQLTISLSQILRQFEEQFGEIELEPAKRRKK